MTTKSILKELKSFGTEQNRKIYRRHGVSDELFGVSYANLDKLAKQIRREGHTDLAGELWDSGNHDAKVLATKIIRSENLGLSKANMMVRGVTHSLQAVGLASVVAEREFAPRLAEKWIGANVSRSLWKIHTGWALVASIALSKKMHADIPNAWFVEHLKQIEAVIHESPNDIREQMNQTVIAIGVRNEVLRKRATASAKRIGKVEVDHGETSCKTPNAVEYIEKVWGRK